MCIVSGVLALGGPKPASVANAQDVRLTGNVTFHTPDRNGDNLAEALVADVEFEFRIAGEYSVTGSLQHDGKTIAYRPTFESAISSGIRLSGAPGIHTQSISFSGEEIFQSGEDGHYDVVLVVMSERGYDTLTLRTPAYDHSRFGEIGAAITGVTDAPVDENHDGKLESVEVTVEVTVRTAGDYWLQASLGKEGETICHAGGSFTFIPGKHSSKLRLPGRPILRTGMSGPYEGSVNINGEGDTLGGVEFVTKAYGSNTFAALLELDGRFKDQVIDTNGNGLFDILRIDFGADVKEAGTLLVQGKLKSPSDPNGVFADKKMALATGPQVLTLEFDGRLVRAQDISGPYEVELVVYDPKTYDRLDWLPLGQRTAAYRHTDFEPFGWTSIRLTGKASDKGVDSNGNGLFEELRMEVEVELAKTDFYEWSATLKDAHGTNIDIDVRRATLHAGKATIDFIFEGTKIRQNGVDGPYSLKALGMFGKTGSNTVVLSVVQTQVYSFTRFER